MNPADYLTTAQLAALYPVDGRVVPAQWYRAVERWRDQGLLRSDVSPEHVRSVGRTRTYLHGRIAQIVIASHYLFAERVLHSNRPAILQILQSLKIPSIASIPQK